MGGLWSPDGDYDDSHGETKGMMKVKQEITRIKTYPCRHCEEVWIVICHRYLGNDYDGWIFGEAYRDYHEKEVHNVR